MTLHRNTTTDSLTTVTRRDAMRLALTSGLGVATLPSVATAMQSQPNTNSTQAEEVAIDNDYPYFGYEPETTR